MMYVCWKLSNEMTGTVVYLLHCYTTYMYVSCPCHITNENVVSLQLGINVLTTHGN